jgi:hypothetical protein
MWRWVVRLTLWPPWFQYLQEKSVGGYKDFSERGVENKNILLLSGIQTFRTRAPPPPPPQPGDHAVVLAVS